MAFCSRLKTSPLCVHCHSRDASRTFVMGKTHDILPLEAVHQIQVSPVEPDRRLTRHICNVTILPRRNQTPLSDCFMNCRFKSKHAAICIGAVVCCAHETNRSWRCGICHGARADAHVSLSIATWYAILTIDVSAYRRLLLPLSLC